MQLFWHNFWCVCMWAGVRVHEAEEACAHTVCRGKRTISGSTSPCLWSTISYSIEITKKAWQSGQRPSGILRPYLPGARFSIMYHPLSHFHMGSYCGTQVPTFVLQALHSLSYLPTVSVNSRKNVGLTKLFVNSYNTLNPTLFIYIMQLKYINYILPFNITCMCKITENVFWNCWKKY